MKYQNRIHIIKYSSRKTISLSVTSLGKVVINAPKKMSARDIGIFYQNSMGWIKKRQLVISNNRKKVKKLCTETDTSKSKAEAKFSIPARVALISNRLDINYGKVRISNAKTRWGYCSPSKTIGINWRLIFAPEEVLDYVISHELVHLLYMNHSKQFWSKVEKICPNYKYCRNWLKNNQYLMLA